MNGLGLMALGLDRSLLLTRSRQNKQLPLLQRFTSSRAEKLIQSSTFDSQLFLFDVNALKRIVAHLVTISFSSAG